MCSWPIEDIPDADLLYYWANRAHFFDGSLDPGVFRDREGSMSTSWAKYSSAEVFRQRARKPEDNAVLELTVMDVRAIDPLEVRHSPDLADRSHTDVIGEKSTEVRLKLMRAFRWAIPPSWSPPQDERGPRVS
jgi:hypothetical protein